MKKNREQGSALVAALGLIFTASMLTGAVILMSTTAAFDMTSHTQRQRSFYICEGASTRVQWLIAAENSVNGSGSEILGSTDYSQFETDRWLPDGVIHDLDYHGTPLKIRITDAQSGWPMNGSSATQLLNGMISNLEETEPERADELDLLLPKISDYTDSDDETAEDGFDTADYEEADMAPLPRNGNMQFREEFLFIPGFSKLFPPDENGRLSGIMLLSLSNRSSREGIKTSFFTASREMIKLMCNFEDDQVDSVLEAREAWFKDKTILSDELEGDLYATLTSNFQWTPTGYYTVSISPAEKIPFVRRIFSFQAFDISGPNNNIVNFLEWWNL